MSELTYKFPKNEGEVYMESSVLYGNTDIYIHHHDGLQTRLTIENRDIRGAASAFQALGYKVVPKFYNEEAEY